MLRCKSPLLLALLFAAAGTSLLSAGDAKKSKSSGDSGPVLLSRTGGSSWADLKELQAAAAKGNPKAEAALGEMLLRGDGLTQDEAQAVALFEKAARAGHSGAAFRLGMLHADGEGGLAQDHARALAYFRAAAAGGEAEAFFNIGAAYGSARGVKRDYAEALAWLILAKQKGAGAEAEASLRARIKTRTDWIATAERRAKEIMTEFEGKKMADFLPEPVSLAAKAK